MLLFRYSDQQQWPYRFIRSCIACYGIYHLNQFEYEQIMFFFFTFLLLDSELISNITFIKNYQEAIVHICSFKSLCRKLCTGIFLVPERLIMLINRSSQCTVSYDGVTEFWLNYQWNIIWDSANMYHVSLWWRKSAFCLYKFDKQVTSKRYKQNKGILGHKVTVGHWRLAQSAGGKLNIFHLVRSFVMEG